MPPAIVGQGESLIKMSVTYGDVRPDHLIKQAKRVRLLTRKTEE
jgi:hypothetical protein